MDDWRRVQKQPKMADWFEKSHGEEERMQFFIGAAKGYLPCWSPSAQAIESWHRMLADLPGLIMRASFTNMLEVNIPAICRDASINLATTGWLLMPDFVPYEMAVAPVDRCDNGPSLMHSADKQVYKIISRKYWSKYPKVEMSKELLLLHENSKRGIFPAGVTKERAQEIATCIHTLVVDPRCKGPTNPGWRCDCKKFVHIGLCSCVLCVAELQGTMDVKGLLKK